MSTNKQKLCSYKDITIDNYYIIDSKYSAKLKSKKIKLTTAINKAYFYLDATNDYFILILNEVIRDVKFCNINISNISFCNCVFVNCVFNDLIIKYCNFYSCTFDNCIFKEMNFTDIGFYNWDDSALNINFEIKFDNTTNYISNSSFIKVSFAGVCFDNIIFDKTHINNCDFYNYGYRECKIGPGGLSHFNKVEFALFKQSSIEGSSFRKVSFDGVRFESADIANNTFIGSYFDRIYITLESHFSTNNFISCDFNNSIDLTAKQLGTIVNSACPSDGSFIGWKKILSKKDNKLLGARTYYLIKLEIPEDAKRSSSTSKKCRCDKAKVLAIYEYDVITDKFVEYKGSVITNIKITSLGQTYKTDYKVGEYVYPHLYDDNPLHECSGGIHFFINKQDAIDYIC